MIKYVAATAAVVAGLSGCGGSETSDVTETQTSTASPSEDNSSATTEQGTIIQSGFGQQDQYAWVMALVQNNADHAGQTVIVNFNLKDDTGKLVGSGSQTAAFNWPDQKLPVATQVDLGSHVKATSVEATVLVKDDGTFEDQVTDSWGGPIKGDIYKSEYGSWGAKFTVKNPTSDPLTSPQFEVICHGPGGKIVGGGESYPDLIPPSGETLVNLDSLYTDHQPHDCDGYLHPWM
ncbi:hypothetical protein [Nocardioides sp. KR10-350]|uniref:hypothetical protein n=1 Tax=Nocardioides cheoyonin TaxID=3156615 RepID=UPI0032B56B51